MRYSNFYHSHEELDSCYAFYTHGTSGSEEETEGGGKAETTEETPGEKDEEAEGKTS